MRRESVAEDSRAFYDTNVLIAYLFKEERRFNIAKQVLRKHTLKAVSIISIHEIHMYSIKFNVEDKFINIKEPLHKLFKITPLNQNICIKASHIRRKYKLPEIDALILATAVYEKYPYFYTFDKDFEKLNDIKIEETTIYYVE